MDLTLSKPRLTHDAKTKYLFAMPEGTLRAVTLLRMFRTDQDSLSESLFLQYLALREIQNSLIALICGVSVSRLLIAANTRCSRRMYASF
jgi:hypothetical protein